MVCFETYQTDNGFYKNKSFHKHVLEYEKSISLFGVWIFEFWMKSEEIEID